MTGLPWYKCDPRAFNDGMIGLTPAERGAYVTVLNAIYIEGGPVQDSALYWTHALSIQGAVWAKLRTALIAKGKLFEAPTDDGEPGLYNRRAAEEIDNQLSFKSAQAERGRLGGSASRKKPRSDKGISRRLASAKPALSGRLATAKPIEIEREIYPKPSQEGSRAKGSEVQEEALPPNVVALGRDAGR